MTKSWSILRDHIYYNMCDEDDNKFEWFMTWMAHIVQKPNEKYGMAVVVTGAEGSGKSTIFNFLKDLLPAGSYKTSTPYYSTYGNLPNITPYTRLAILDEWTEDFHEHHASKLKHLLTDSTWVYEAKGIDAVEYNNYLRIALISSEQWFVPGCDRRYVKFEMSDDAVGEHSYFKMLYRQMNEGQGIMVFREVLENWIPPQEDGWDCLRSAPEEEEPYAVFDLETRGIEDNVSYVTGGAIKPIQYFAYQQEAFDMYNSLPETKLPKTNWGILGEKPGWIKNSIIDDALATSKPHDALQELSKVYDYKIVNASEGMIEFTLKDKEESPSSSIDEAIDRFDNDYQKLKELSPAVKITRSIDILPGRSSTYYEPLKYLNEIQSKNRSLQVQAHASERKFIKLTPSNKPRWHPNLNTPEKRAFLKKLRDGDIRFYGPDNWTAQELIHCVDSNGTAYLAEQNNWNESDVVSWYNDATNNNGVK